MLRSHPGRALGIALIYRDIIRDLADSAEKERAGPRASRLTRLLGRESASRRGGHGRVRHLEARAGCPACDVSQGAEAEYLDVLLAHLDDKKLYDAYADGEGLCLVHLLGALERCEDEATMQRLVVPQVVRYRLMLNDLDEFIRKRDHRFRGEKYGDEGDVWLRAMNVVVGGAGMGLSARWGGRRSHDLGKEGR